MQSCARGGVPGVAGEASNLGLVALPLGWRTEWRGRRLHLRVRRALPSSTSLRGLHFTLDPGHPPDGTLGPSGLREDSVTLAVALVAAERLRRLGATVRPAWASASLVEGSGIVIPERKAFVRTQGGIDAYARGLVNRIERWQRMSASRALPVVR